MNKVFQQALSNLSKGVRTSSNEKAEPKMSMNTLMLARNLVAPHYTEETHRKQKDGTPIPETSDISKMFKSATTAVQDARNILKSSPELCMGIDIYIAGLLSPNDVSAPDLNITSTVNGELSTIKSKLLDVVRHWAKEEYKIDSRLKEWVFKAKYLQGGVPLAVIPLTAIDTIINEEDRTKRKISLESYDASSGYFSNGFYKPTGLLGAGRNASSNKERKNVFQTLKMESAGNTAAQAELTNQITLSDFDKKQIGEEIKDPTLYNKTIEAIGNIIVHDNIEALKMPSIASAAARRSIKHHYSPLYSLAMEDDPDTGANELAASAKEIEVRNGKLIYPERHYSLSEVVNIRPSDIYENVGQPLIKELPYDCCFPISPPGLPDQHLIYLIALDATGSPLTNAGENMGIPDPADINMQTSSGVMGTQMLAQIGDASIDGAANMRFGGLNNPASRLFNTFLVADIKERLKNGLYSGIELDVKFTEAFLEQMWRRALMGKQVQFLLIPTELLTYIAFDFNELGLGESKLAKHKNVAVIASTVQVANALTAVNNSIQHKKATITFDEDEIDAFDTDEKLKQYIVRSQWANTLFSSSNTQDQLNHILNSGWQFSYENGNGSFPGTSYDVEYLTREANQIDNDYLDTVNKRLIMLSGVSPEIVDMSQEVEFASTYITGHMLRAQQASLEQVIFCKALTRLIQAFCMNSQPIIKQLYTIIKDFKTAPESPIKNSKKSIRELIEEFIESIDTSLPKPDTTKLSAQKENLETHEGFIDKVIEIYFSDPLFAGSEVGEKLGEKLDLFKAMWKASYLRGVLQTNNLVPSQFQALHGDVDEEDFVDPFLEGETIVKNFTKLALQHEAEIAKLSVNNDKTIDNIEARTGGGDGGTGGGSDAETPAPSETNDDNNDTGNDDNKAPAGSENTGDDLFGDASSDNPLG